MPEEAGLKSVLARFAGQSCIPDLPQSTANPTARYAPCDLRDTVVQKIPGGNTTTTLADGSGVQVYASVIVSDSSVVPAALASLQASLASGSFLSGLQAAGGYLSTLATSVRLQQTGSTIGPSPVTLSVASMLTAASGTILLSQVLTLGWLIAGTG